MVDESSVGPSHIDVSRPSDAKAALRSKAKANRSALRVDSVRTRAGLMRFFETLDSGWIVVFDAMPGEPELMPLLEEMTDRPFALTRTPDTGRRLTLHDARGELEVHRFGYRQPLASADEIDDADVAAICVPGLAFDRYGGRLGFGAGYYDRLLPRLPATAPIIGVTDGFLIERVPTDAHDVMMTHLATEIGVMALPLRSPVV